MLFTFINMLFSYYVEFNYIMIILIPFLNSFIVIYVQFDQNYGNFFLLPEFIYNIFFYYAIYIIRKYEFSLNKKFFCENFKNQQYIKYIAQLLDVINTQVISLNKEDILFINKSAANFLEKQNFPFEDKKNLNETEKSKINDEVIQNLHINEKVFSFFSNLKNAHYITKSNKNEEKSLNEMINECFNDDFIESTKFTRVGYFSTEKHLNSFEVYVRKLMFKQQVLEILLYDITDIKQAEQIKIESKYKKRILAKIAHEFKTPLITIISLINRILDYQERTNLDNNITTNLNHIENLSNYTLVLIGDITQYVSDSLDLKLFKKDIFIKDTLEFSYNVLQTLIICDENKVNKVQPKLILKENIDKIQIISDENRLKQILLNFVSNAYKFTISGFIKIKAKIIPKDQILEISVKDTGIGIKEDKHSYVFQEFTQFNINNEFNSKGSGLGLSICKNIAVALRHKIGFSSKYGKGSKFYLRIEYKDLKYTGDFNYSVCYKKPRKINSEMDLVNSKSIRSEFILKNPEKNNENEINAVDKLGDSFITLSHRFNLVKDDEMNEYLTNINREIAQIKKYSNKFVLADLNDINSYKYKIAVIDDQKLVRENTIRLIKIVMSSLNMCDYIIVEGSDGIELLNLIRLDKDSMIRYIFIDENMEYLNGTETVKIIRKLENYSKIKKYFIISISALDDEESHKNLLEAGVDIIIPKPCSKSDLINVFSKNV